jgi:hypothetical protein
MPQAVLACRRVSPKLAVRVSEKLGYVFAPRVTNSNNYLDKSHQTDVRCRAIIPTSGLKSAPSRRTHPKNPQCGN